MAGSSTALAETPAERFGIVTFSWDSTIAAKVTELGAGVIRAQCRWRDMETAPGVFNWDCSDSVINGANSHGVKVLLTVECPPLWANGNLKVCLNGPGAMPTNIAHWYNFAAAFIQRYAGNRDVALGVWNEPNLNNISAANYCALFTNASAARTAHDAGFVLAGPETSHHALNGYPWPTYFSTVMDCIRANQAFAAWDAITAHWYDDGPPLATYMDRVRVASGLSNEVWLSETGKNTAILSEQAAFYHGRMDDMQTLTLSRPWWTRMIFYRLHDPTSDYGILFNDYTNKPAFNTYRSWIADVTGNSSGAMPPNTFLFVDEQITSANGLYYLYYQGDGNLVLYGPPGALWASNTAGTSPGHAVMQGDGNLVVYDANGQVRWASNTEGHPDAYAVVENWGDFFIFDESGAPVLELN